MYGVCYGGMVQCVLVMDHYCDNTNRLDKIYSFIFDLILAHIQCLFEEAILCLSGHNTRAYDDVECDVDVS